MTAKKAQKGQWSPKNAKKITLVCAASAHPQACAWNDKKTQKCELPCTAPQEVAVLG